MQGTKTRDEMHSKQTVTPPMDVYESEDAYVLVGDLPGAKPEQLELKVEQGVLILDTCGVDPDWEYGRSFRLSDDVDLNAIEAKLDAGVLVLRLPKREELRPRKIPVHS